MKRDSMAKRITKIIAALSMSIAWTSAAAVQMNEFYDYGSASGFFTVNNLGEPTAIPAFAVANDNVTLVISTATNAGVWAAGIIDEPGWNAAQPVFAAGFGVVVPTFNTIFPGKSRAAVYYAESLLAEPVRDAIAALSWIYLDRLSAAQHADPIQSSKYILPFIGITGGFEFFSPTPASPWIALTVTDIPVRTYGFVTGTTSDIIVGSPPAPVPEPSTYALMLAGIAVVGLAAKRARKARASA